VSLLLLTLGADCIGFKRWAYEGGDRDEWQRPGEVVATLELGPGSQVADVGSGSGYFTRPLSRWTALAQGPPRVHYAWARSREDPRTSATRSRERRASSPVRPATTRS
jgi:predicted methyltransferase